MNDITGFRFGRLVALEFAGKLNNTTMWECVCDCGNKKIIRLGNLLSGNTKSCGCYERESKRLLSITHGKSLTPTYHIWAAVKRRCQNENSADYPRYGARGIRMCRSWQKYENFVADMGERPMGLTIERIDNSKGYSPKNCKWASYEEQANNKRNNRFLTFKKQTFSVAQWSRRLGINSGTLSSRINKRGWSIERALSTVI